MDKDGLLSIPSCCEVVKRTGKLNAERSGHVRCSSKGKHRIVREQRICQFQGLTPFFLFSTPLLHILAAFLIKLSAVLLSIPNQAYTHDVLDLASKEAIVSSYTVGFGIDYP
jgi:hypothetical protein